MKKIIDIEFAVSVGVMVIAFFLALFQIIPHWLVYSVYGFVLLYHIIALIREWKD